MCRAMGMRYSPGQVFQPRLCQRLLWMSSSETGRLKANKQLAHEMEFRQGGTGYDGDMM